MLDGLSGAAQAAGGSFDASAMRTTLAGLGKRVFLMNNVHERAPVLFHTRWAMSFLRGPLTRDQIGVLSPAPEAPIADVATRTKAASATGAVATAAVAAAVAGSGPASSSATPSSSARPVLPDYIEEEIFVGEPVGDFVYRPAILATVRLHYSRAAAGIDTWYEPTVLAPLTADAPNAIWDAGMYVDPAQMRIREAPLAAKGYQDVPAKALQKGKLRSLKSALKKHLHATAPLQIGHCKSFKMYSTLGETPDAFYARLRQAVREDRDAKMEKVKEKFAAKHAKLAAKIDKAEDKVAKEKGQARQKKVDTGLTVATSVIGAIFGRRSVAAGARSAATAARRASRVASEADDVKRAEEKLTDLQAELEELDTELKFALVEVKAETMELPPVDEIAIAPKKGDIEIIRFAVAWTPVASG